MNLPGFSAEASLYQTSGRYRIAAAGIATQQGELLPQQFGLRDLIVPIETFREILRGLRHERCNILLQGCLSRCSSDPIPSACYRGCFTQYNHCTFPQ